MGQTGDSWSRRDREADAHGMEATSATEWVSVAEAAVRLEVDPKTIQRRMDPGHRKHLRSRPGPRGTEVEVPAKTTTAAVANAMTLHAEREIQLAGSIVASVERERRTMRGVAIGSAATAVVAFAGLALLWNAYAQQGAALALATASAEQAESLASSRATEIAAAEESARYWRTVAQDERTARVLAGQSSYIVRPDLLAAE